MCVCWFLIVFSLSSLGEAVTFTASNLEFFAILFVCISHPHSKPLHVRHGMGLSTGIDLDRLIDTGKFISDILKRPTASVVAKDKIDQR
jgi:hypothetical protein